ncbi:MAG TPA: hypothetical protein VF746_00330 [Longimicrobium sp.]|jgi:hypothetical protein
MYQRARRVLTMLLALFLTVGSALPLRAQDPDDEVWYCWYQGRWVVDGVVQDAYCEEFNTGAWMLVAIRLN